MKTLQKLHAENITVFYRPDYNVPLKDGEIQDDYRITATLPTLDLLADKGAKIVIGTHLGRPEGKPSPEFELRPVAERLADLLEDRTVRLAHEIEAPEVKQAIEDMEAGDILLLPNLRFYPGEETNDEEFAKTLASLADVYVNDAFACDHRAHASIVGVPKIIPGYAGLLLEDELASLSQIVEDPEKPFVVLMGGAKVSDKIEVIRRLGHMADHILIGGAMANTFLLAKGEPIGKSKAEEDKVDLAKSLMEDLGDKLVLAADYVKDGTGGDFRYLDIGDKAVEQFKGYLAEAKTIFWNGSLGYTEDNRYAVGSQAIAEYIGGLKNVTSVVAGGDTVEMITRLNLHEDFSFVSTGGGAALEYLAGAELPGVAVLEK